MDSTVTTTREGRRIYITLPYGSPAKDPLKTLGAHWDPSSKRWWIGSGKAEQVQQIVDAENERLAADEPRRAEAREHVAQLKATGVAVKIPFEATDIRDAAKSTGAVWDRDRKVWILDADKATGIQEQVNRWRHAHTPTTPTPNVADDAGDVGDVGAVIARSGRSTIGDRATYNGSLTGRGRMNRATATATAPRVGDVRHLDGGGRILVLTPPRLWFMSEDALADQGEDWQDPHWRYSYTGVPVAPTAAETDADAHAAQRGADEAALRALLTQAGLDRNDADSDTVERLEQWSPRPDDPGPQIRHDNAMASPTTVYLDGETLVYQHPGHYDDWRHIELRHSSPTLRAEFERLTAFGARRYGNVEVTARPGTVDVADPASQG